MKLVEDWKLIIKHAWSVKFTLLASLLAGVEVGVQIWIPQNIPNGLFAALAAVVSALAPIARIVAQKEVNANDPAPAPK